MGLVRRLVPLSRAGLALWAWNNRDELTRWAGFAAASVGRIAEGGTRDVVAEARLRASLTSDPRTRGAKLDVEVREGVATLRGEVSPEVQVAALSIAERASGVRSVRDQMTGVGRARRPFMRRTSAGA